MSTNNQMINDTGTAYIIMIHGKTWLRWEYGKFCDIVVLEVPAIEDASFMSLQTANEIVSELTGKQPEQRSYNKSFIEEDLQIIKVNLDYCYDPMKA